MLCPRKTRIGQMTPTDHIRYTWKLNRWKVFLDLQLERRMKGQNWQLVITLDNLFRFYCEKDKNPIHRFTMHSKQFK